MKLPLLSATLITCAALVPGAVAHGPGMNPAPGNTTSTSRIRTDPRRQQWVRQRLEQLEHNREHYESEKARAGLLMTPLGGQPSDLVEIAKFKMWEANTKTQRHRERVETLMLKRENGTITREESRALDKWLHQHTRQH